MRTTKRFYSLETVVLKQRPEALRVSDADASDSRL